MANYPTPDIANLTSFFTYMNTVTGSLFGMSIVLLTFIISFMAMMRYQMENALMSSMFITFVISVLVWSAGILGSQFVMWIMIALGAVIVMQWFNTQ